LREEKLKRLEERERELDERQKVLEEKEPRAFVKFRIILETSLSLKHIRRSTSKLIHRQPHHQNTLEDIHASLSAKQPHNLVTLQPHGIIRQARISQAHTFKAHFSSTLQLHAIISHARSSTKYACRQPHTLIEHMCSSAHDMCTSLKDA
jgi:hypothetical protein